MQRSSVFSLVFIMYKPYKNTHDIKINHIQLPTKTTSNDEESLSILHLLRLTHGKYFINSRTASYKPCQANPEHGFRWFIFRNETEPATFKI